MSSQSRYSSSASWNRSAAILGSQYRFGRLPRTDSAASRTSGGTNGYGFSFKYQACMAPPSSRRHERPDVLDERAGLLDLGVVPSRPDELEARAGDTRAVGAAVRLSHDPVARPPQYQRRDRDAAEPPGELRIVQVGMPRVEAERLAAARVRDQGLVRQRVRVRGPLRGLVPAAAPHLGGRGVEHVEDVGRLAVADLDADRVDQDQALHAGRSRRRDLGGQPAAEREA